MTQDLPNDPLGAFCRENHVALKGSGSGPLAGLTFAAKDIFEIAGARTGFGQPDWLRTHPPAQRNRRGGAASARRRRRSRRQDPLRRALLQPDRRECALRHAAERECAGPRAGRIVERVGGRGRGRAGRFRARHRLRRLDPHSGELLRHHRAASDARARLGQGRAAVRPELRRGRLVRARYPPVRKGRRRVARRRQGRRAAADDHGAGCLGGGREAGRRCAEPGGRNGQDHAAAMPRGRASVPRVSPTGSRCSARCRRERSGRRSAPG